MKIARYGTMNINFNNSSTMYLLLAKNNRKRWNEISGQLNKVGKLRENFQKGDPVLGSWKQNFAEGLGI